MWNGEILSRIEAVVNKYSREKLVRGMDNLDAMGIICVVLEKLDQRVKCLKMKNGKRL